MNTLLITADVTSALYLIVIAIGLFQVPKGTSKSTRCFAYTIWFTIVGLVAETLICVFEGKAEYSVLLLALHTLASVTLDLIVISYSFYLFDLISESRKNFKKIFTYVISALCTADILLVFVGIITGKLFEISEGKLIPGPLDPFFGAVPAICFLMMVVLYVVRFKDFRIKSPVFVVLIVLVPTVATVLLKLSSSVRYGYSGSAISLAVVFVVIQTRIIAETQAAAIKYSDISVTDQLTGLRNRRGYIKLTENLSPEKVVGVAFVDINSLKAVNDEFGHEAGDELIKKVADICKETVTCGTAFRISGDEFVCIAEKADPKDFEDCMANLRNVIFANDRIAAMGYAIGKGKDIKRLVNLAEHGMYEDKERYYKETGKDRRR